MTSQTPSRAEPKDPTTKGSNQETPSQAPMSQVWLGLAPRRRDEGSIDAILLMFTTIGRNMQIAVLSNGRLDPWINWSTLGPPLLRPLATMTGVLLSPPGPRQSRFHALRRRSIGLLMSRP